MTAQDIESQIAAYYQQYGQGAPFAAGHSQAALDAAKQAEWDRIANTPDYGEQRRWEERQEQMHRELLNSIDSIQFNDPEP